MQSVSFYQFCYVYSHRTEKFETPRGNKRKLQKCSEPSESGASHPTNFMK